MRITAVVPTYNRARWLPEVVASLRAQTRPPDEILVIDDGSTDDTAEVCAALPAPVRYLRQENAGVSAARNRGIREARGEWIALADSDDLWMPRKLEIQLAALAACPEAGWCLSGCTRIDLEGRALPGVQGFERVFPVFSELGRSAEAHFASALSRREVIVAGEAHPVFTGDAFGLWFHGNVGLPASALVHRDALARAGSFDESWRVAEETEFFHRLAAVSPVAIVLTPLVGYRVAQAGSLTAGANVPVLIEQALRSLERAATLRTPLSPAEAEAYRAGRERLLLRLAYTRLSLLDGAGARQILREEWGRGLGPSRRALAIGAASLLPTALLRGLHALKQRAAA